MLKKIQSYFDVNGSKMTEQDIFIQRVNKLHDTLSGMGVHAQFDLPQIAVVGSQSAGKSSVLENLVGWDFLPKGTGVVTRCPLILQMLNGPKMFGKFTHSEEEFTDFVRIRNEIEKITIELVGDDKGISENTINLKIYSPDFLNLTLVDLPGVTKIPIGSQPEDIGQQVEKIILKYIEKDSCLILAVTPANDDLANSDALNLARKVDKEGKRTIGVLTKLDIMNKGTNVRNVFLGELYDLPRGYVGVVCRSQDDINSKKGINDKIKEEKLFFETHPSYHDLAERMGTTFLQRKLNADLAKHIREKLPEFREQILNKKQEAMNTLKTCQEIDLSNGGVTALYPIIKMLNLKTMQCIKGTAEDIPQEQRVGTKISSFYHETLENQYWKEEIKEKEIHNEIATGIKNAGGIETNLYASDDVLSKVTKNRIKEKGDSMKQCAEEVVQELREFYDIVVDETTSGCRFMGRKIKDNIQKQLTIYHLNCKLRLEEALLEEICFINKKQIDFINSNQLPDSELIQTGTLFLLFIANISINKKYWCTLSLKLFNLYDVETMKLYESHSIKFVTAQDGECKFVVNTTSSALILVAENPPIYNIWKNAFISAGVIEITLDQKCEVEDAHMEKQIHQVRKDLALYMRVFTKRFLDTVPRKITFHVVDKIIDYINNQLFNDLAADNNLINLLQENPQQKEKREKASAELKVCKKALQIIDDQDAKLASD